MQLFDPTRSSRDAHVQVVLGMPGHGKSTYICKVLQEWSKRGARGISLAVDGVCPDKPEPHGKHIAGWATHWCRPEALKDLAALPEQISMVACDEAALCLSTGRTDFRIMEQLIRRGRHTGPHGVTLLLGTQRVVDPRLAEAWTNAQRVVIFRMRGPNELERISKLAGMTQEALERIPHLPPGYCVVWDIDEGLWYPWVKEWL